MSDRLLEEIKLARYARWLRRFAGESISTGLTNGRGELLLTEDDVQVGSIADLLPAHIAGGFDWACDGRGMQVRRSGGTTLLYQPLFARGDSVIGYLLTFLANVSLEKLDSLAEAFDDLVTAIGEELQTAGELDDMATELSERYEELHLVYAVDEQMRRLKCDENIFSNLLKSCAEHMNADVAVFVRPDQNLCVAATNLSEPIHNLDLVLVEMRGDLFRFVHAARQPIVLNSTTDPRRAYIFTDMPLKILCCPIFQDNAVVAVLVLVNTLSKPDFSNSDRKLGEVLSNQLSNLSRLYGMLTEAGQFNAQMAAALIESVEAKDPYTRGHSERVHHISMEIGRALKLSETELEDLHWGSLLHDVGKIGIPDAILCKPSRLTEDEYTFIMVHPERSYEILRHIGRLKGAVPGARHHQEKFDGTGYPHGLKGDAIPLHARIIAVADTYDSITSSRAYRAGRSHEVAMSEIRRVTGLQLDPKMVAVLETVCAEEPEWMRRFGIRRETLTGTAA